MSAEGLDRITPFFNGRNVLICGGTGFVGKTFVEKLLRSCPDIGLIYLMIRSKKGKNSSERLQEMFDCVLFDKLKAERGLDALMKKCKVVAGDLQLLDLGMPVEDREDVTKNVDIIYNLAASIRFNDTLTKSVINNTRGVREVLALAKQCKRLELFLHMSTAYSFPEQKCLEERAYDPPADPHKMINLVETMSEDNVNELTKGILGLYPNTYSYTKALAEGLVNEASKKGLPTLIVRPSIIVPILYEPVPGWTDNVHGPTGLMLAGGSGVLRVMLGDKEANADFVPVDLLANALCLSAWNYVALGDCKRVVTNYVSSAEVKVSFDEFNQRGMDAVTKGPYPFDYVLWHPNVSFIKSEILYKFLAVLFHWIPALLIDCILPIFGQKPILWKIQKRVALGVDVVKYYTTNKWDFINEGVLYLRSIMNEAERKNYCIHSEGLDLTKYYEDGTLALRRHIFKYKDENLPRARRVMKTLFYVDKIFKISLAVLLAYWTSKLVLFGISGYLNLSS